MAAVVLVTLVDVCIVLKNQLLILFCLGDQLPVVLKVLQQLAFLYVVVYNPHLLLPLCVRSILGHRCSGSNGFLIWLLKHSIYNITLLDVCVSDFSSDLQVFYHVVVRQEHGAMVARN